MRTVAATCTASRLLTGLLEFTWRSVLFWGPREGRVRTVSSPPWGLADLRRRPGGEGTCVRRGLGSLIAAPSEGNNLTPLLLLSPGWLMDIEDGPCEAGVVELVSQAVYLAPPLSDSCSPTGDSPLPVNCLAATGVVSVASLPTLDSPCVLHKQSDCRAFVTTFAEGAGFAWEASNGSLWFMAPMTHRGGLVLDNLDSPGTTAHQHHDHGWTEPDNVAKAEIAAMGTQESLVPPSAPAQTHEEHMQALSTATTMWVERHLLPPQAPEDTISGRLGEAEADPKDPNISKALKEDLLIVDEETGTTPPKEELSFPHEPLPQASNPERRPQEQLPISFIFR
ncbi:hypothetical protein NDU88_010235 [Pleurodeles waltl]|uniref:Uncharacterized protein n=1 Tax=Pleurodeles waltl TaxID=8319 RepID=A0AAV7PY39_PLEWA|nr:hypothetical protein NDU88_010235 [Pleurodeles waltl]